MGRYDLRPQHVRRTASLLMSVKRQPQPPWYQTMSDIPPPEILVRTLPVTQRTPRVAGRRNTKRPSKMFTPQAIHYPEDKIRSEFFEDHPWELARPKVVLEEDGKDYQRWDWSKAFQAGRPIGGESVVQRQRYLMQQKAGPLTQARLAALGPGASQAERNRASDAAMDEIRNQAYDQARKEFYAQRHDHEVETRVAREEAMAVGAIFGLTQNEVGMGLESQTFDQWRAWAEAQVVIQEQAKAGAYTGGAGSGRGGSTTADDGAENANAGEGRAAVEELQSSIPGSKQGQKALGGAATTF